MEIDMNEQQKAIMIASGRDPEEFGLVEELASLLGLKRATALKLHLRESLPSKIAKLRRRRQEQSLEILHTPQIPIVVSEG
jgi:hypothetical protein